MARRSQSDEDEEHQERRAVAVDVRGHFRVRARPAVVEQRDVLAEWGALWCARPLEPLRVLKQRPQTEERR